MKRQGQTGFAFTLRVSGAAEPLAHLVCVLRKYVMPSLVTVTYWEMHVQRKRSGGDAEQLNPDGDGAKTRLCYLRPPVSADEPFELQSVRVSHLDSSYTVVNREFAGKRRK